MTDYVVGFYFSTDYQRVVLIRKKRPEWQAGYLNGVGGKVEEHETPGMAMIREFHEEANVYTQDWRRFCLLRENRATIAFFETSGSLENIKAKTDEPIETIFVSELDQYETLSNLKWLVPLAKDPNKFNGTLFETVQKHIE